MMLRQVLDKQKVSWLLTSLLVVAPNLGAAIGICTHRSDVGVAVSATVFALATFLQGLVAWIQH